MSANKLTSIQMWMLDHLTKSANQSMDTHGISRYRARDIYGNDWLWGKCKLSVMNAMRALERKRLVHVAAPATQHDHHRVDLLDAGRAAIKRVDQ